jgi:hypothetical protein
MNENTNIPISTWISFMSSFQYFFHVDCLHEKIARTKKKEKKKGGKKKSSSTTLATFLTFLLIFKK